MKKNAPPIAIIYRTNICYLRADTFLYLDLKARKLTQKVHFTVMSRVILISFVRNYPLVISLKFLDIMLMKRITKENIGHIKPI